MGSHSTFLFLSVTKYVHTTFTTMYIRPCFGDAIASIAKDSVAFVCLGLGPLINRFYLNLLIKGCQSLKQILLNLLETLQFCQKTTS